MAGQSKTANVPETLLDQLNQGQQVASTETNPASEEDFEKSLRQDAIEAKNGGLLVEVASAEKIGETKPPMKLEDALRSNSSEARQTVAMNAMIRNRRTKPAMPKKRYVVDDNKTPVMAHSKIEALAVQNDRDGKFPGPYGRKVREVALADESPLTDEDIFRAVNGSDLLG